MDYTSIKEWLDKQVAWRKEGATLKDFDSQIGVIDVGNCESKQIHLYKADVVADMLGIDRNATIAVGDTTNDSQALECAGLSLAMANSVPELKEIADEVICDNNNHAIKYILDHYFK